MGAAVEVKAAGGSLKKATIARVTDQSSYTVGKAMKNLLSFCNFNLYPVNVLLNLSSAFAVFDDGDENTLRRTQLCPKSEKHFLKHDVSRCSSFHAAINIHVHCIVYFMQVRTPFFLFRLLTTYH